MNRATCAVLFLGTLSLVGRGVVGCASNVELGTADDAVSDGATPSDAGTLPDTPEVDGAVGDADASDAARTCSLDGWCYTELPARGTFDAGGIVVPSPRSLFDLRSVWVAPDHRVWAVSDAGHILCWDGSRWDVVFAASERLLSITGTSSTDIWVSGYQGLVLHGTTVNGTMTFEVVSTGMRRGVTAITALSPTDVWILADQPYHLTAETLGSTPAFTEIDIPKGFTETRSWLTIATAWNDGTNVWFAGTEVANCSMPPCRAEAVAWRYLEGTDPATAWERVSIPIQEANTLYSGVTTGDGMNLVSFHGTSDTGLVHGWVARFAPSDAGTITPLPGGSGGVTTDGAYAWSAEIAEVHGVPNGIWAEQKNDIWLVGSPGVVRHFNGTSWELQRVALKPTIPLLANLWGIHGRGDDVWIVGDSVALHRTVKP